MKRIDMNNNRKEALFDEVIKKFNELGNDAFQKMLKSEYVSSYYYDGYADAMSDVVKVLKIYKTLMNN